MFLGLHMIIFPPFLCGALGSSSLTVSPLDPFLVRINHLFLLFVSLDLSLTASLDVICLLLDLPLPMFCPRSIQIFPLLLLLGFPQPLGILLCLHLLLNLLPYPIHVQRSL